MPDTPIEAFERELTRALASPLPANQPPEVSALWDRKGIEVALARERVQESRLRRVWRERQAGRGKPLLVVAPASGSAADERVAVVGPQEGDPRFVEPTALALQVANVALETQQRAFRSLEEWLSHADSEAIRGVVVRQLLTNYYIRTRLPQNKTSEARQLGAAAEPARNHSGWREAMAALGYQVRQLPGTAYELLDGERPQALVHVWPDANLFSRIDEQGRLPEGTLVAQCQNAGIPWGILAAGSRIRLFQAKTERGAATDRWIDLDLSALADEQRYLLGLFAPVALREDGLWPQLLEDARDFGAGLKERLDEQIRRMALPNIGQGLGDSLVAKEGADLADPEVRGRIQQASYTMLFRLLFILYGESAGHLPYTEASYQRNALTTLCAEARDRLDRLDPRSHALWNRLQALTKAVREGDSGMNLPQYNGQLFAADQVPGADLLEAAEVRDTFIGPALVALGYDLGPNGSEAGLDYANLEIGHIGSIYEGLLALRLSLADQNYRFDAKAANGQGRYVPAEEPGEDGVAEGELFFQTEAGGRKGGGVYYTRQEFVRHLVNHSVLPALEEHLEHVKARAATDPVAAERLLFRFRVLDPAMGSGHFLVDALDVISQRVQTFLVETPLEPLKTRLDDLRAEAGAEQADDAQLLKRLLLKHCVYGVDLSEMAVELARVALWLSSFVPGLALSYLDQNLKRGDSLVGVATIDNVLPSKSSGGSPRFWEKSGGPLDEAIEKAGELAAKLGDLPDRTKEEVEQSRALREELEVHLTGARRVFDLWTAEPFGLRGARARLSEAESILDRSMPDEIAREVEKAAVERAKRSFFHWPLEFPEVFHRSSERNPGFDAVIGNPPWDEVTIEELGFYALHDPGIRGLTSGAERSARTERLQERFPHLAEEFAQRQIEAAAQRAFFRPENGYHQQGVGDADLYKLFCERYSSLGRSGGRLGVVLPRSAFLTAGSRGFRRWFFRECQPSRLDIILNNRSWAFPIHPQYTIVLLAAVVGERTKGALVRMTGPSKNEHEFVRAIGHGGIGVPLDDLAEWTPAPLEDDSDEPSWELPLLPRQEYVDVLSKIRQGPRFDLWAREHGNIFPSTELHETQQRAYFRHDSGVPVWKGRSFDQYDPHGREPAGYGKWEDILDYVQRKRISSRSGFARRFPESALKDPATHPIHSARVAFRDVSRATDSRTVRACLVPPETALVNSTPYLVFPSGEKQDEAYVLGIFNSLPFDWQARRYVETHLNFYVLNLLCFPPDDHAAQLAIAERAARLSCVDERFTEFAEATGVEYGPLWPEEGERLRAEIDALVTHAYGLEATDLDAMFEDFTTGAVTPSYRQLVRDKFAELAPAAAAAAQA